MFENFKPKKRLFRLKNDKSPVAYKVQSSHRRRYPLLYKDLEDGSIRELRYVTNMATPFVDEQQGKGTPTLGHITFRDGILSVNENDIALQKFLLVHPHNMENGGQSFYEVKPEEKAIQEVVNLEAAAEAMAIAKDMDIEDASAIVYSQVGGRVDSYVTQEVRREILNLAMTNAPKFLELSNDEMVGVTYKAHQALGYQVLTQSGNNIYFGKTKKKLLTVKPSETSEEAIAKFFMTDDGIEALAEVKKKLKALLS